MVLVREHRVARQTALLRALDLAVPVRALDEADDEFHAVAARDRRHGVDDVQAARLVGLHGQAEPGPRRVLLRHALGQRVEQVERELEAVALLGVDGEVDAVLRGQFDQAPQARQQFGEDAFALRFLVAREEGAELDRDLVAGLRAGGRGASAGGAPGGDGRDGAPVGRQIRERRGVGARAFAEHVEAEAQRGLLPALRAGVGHRVGDRARIDELAAQQLDRAHGGRHHGLRAQALHQAAGLFTFGQEALGQPDRARRQAGQHPVRPLGGVGLEVGAAQLVGGERDRGLGIGHTQQGFGQSHQGQPLGTGNRVLAQQRLHGPERRRLVARALHPRPRRHHHGRPVQAPLQGGQRQRHRLGLGAVREGQTGPGRVGYGWRGGDHGEAPGSAARTAYAARGLRGTRHSPSSVESPTRMADMAACQASIGSAIWARSGAR